MKKGLLIVIIFLCLLLISLFLFQKKEKALDRDSDSESSLRIKSELHTEKSLSITVNPENGSVSSGLDMSVYLYFSEPVNPGDFKFDIDPDPGGWKTDWRRDNTYAVLSHDMPFQPGSVYTLTVSVPSLSAEKKVIFTVYGPSSIELIDRDEKENKIDKDTAWIYRFRSLFENTKLPQRYKSKTPVYCGTGLISEYGKDYRDLKPETRQEIRPYLLPPGDPDSYFNRFYSTPEKQAGFFSFSSRAFAKEMKPEHLKGLVSVDCNENIRVWYRSDDGKTRASEACSLINDNTMYKKFVNLMKMEPESDGHFESIWHGKDGRIDIYLVPGSTVTEIHSEGSMTVHGLCVPYDPEFVDRKTPSWIVIRDDLSGEKLGSTLAHELFHVFQLSIDCKEDEWWMESTAVWAQEYINSSWKDHHRWDSGAFVYPYHRIRKLIDTDDTREYSMYLFPYFLGKKYGDKLIAKIWLACEGEETNSMKAIDGAVPGGFDQTFKKFGLMNYDDTGDFSSDKYPEPVNTLPMHDFYEVEITEDDASRLFEITMLTSTYIHVINKADSSSTPRVRFDLKDFLSNEKITVQAFVDYGDSMDYEDWSYLEERIFCINREEEKFKKVILIVTSVVQDHEYDVIQLKVELSNEECQPTGGQGTFTYTNSYKTTWPEFGGTWNCSGSYYSYSLNAKGSVTFEPYDPEEFPSGFKGIARVSVTERIEILENIVEGKPGRKTEIIRSGTDDVPFTLEYAWGELDAGYTAHFEAVKIKAKETFTDYHSNFPGPPVTKEKEYEGTLTFPLDINWYYNGEKPALGSLEIEGGYTKDDNGNEVASWHFKLKEPSKE